MKLMIDNQLPVALAAHLRGLGDDCVHVLDLGMDTADDSQVWIRAFQEGRIVVSKDEDFIFLANRPGDTGRLIWVRMGNCRNTVLLAAFDRIHADLEKAFQSGQRIVEVR